MRMVFRSPAFFILLALGIANSVAGLSLSNQLYGTPALPLTFTVIGTLQGAFSLFVIIIAIYYSGELVWRDRERKVHEIIDATALPNWAYMVPKTLAVTGVLFSTLVAAMLTGVVIQLIRGVTNVELGQYMAWYLVPQTVDMVLLAVLAVFVQALSPNKYVGWAIMVVYLVASITLGNIGFDHPLYSYGFSSSGTQLSDMNGDQIGGAVSWWLRLYWRVRPDAGDPRPSAVAARHRDAAQASPCAASRAARQPGGRVDGSGVAGVRGDRIVPLLEHGRAQHLSHAGRSRPDARGLREEVPQIREGAAALDYRRHAQRRLLSGRAPGGDQRQLSVRQRYRRAAQRSPRPADRL
jgi:hypothetical protein